MLRNTRMTQSFTAPALRQPPHRSHQANGLGGPGPLVKITVLLAILDESKKVGDKVLVFSQSRYILDYLESICRSQQRRFSRMDGSTKIGLRQRMIQDFNNNDDELYLISTEAGGVGLNIQGANRVVIFDFKWNPINEQQAIGRAYRIGQKKPVFVYWLIVGGTYETLLHNQAVFKYQLASRVIDKKNLKDWARQLKDYSQPPQIIEMDNASLDKHMGRDSVLDAVLRNLPQGIRSQDPLYRYL